MTLDDSQPRRAGAQRRIPGRVGEGFRMIVDGSYTAWVRPTRRVHFAFSVGMTLTGVILIAVGAFGGRSAAPFSPALGRTADSVVSGSTGTPGSLVSPVPAAPLLPLTRVAPPVTTTPGTAPPSPEAKPAPKSKHHAKPRPHPRHAAPAPPPTPDSLPLHPPKH